MQPTARSGSAILLSPLVLFLALMLGFPLLTNVVYSFSQVSFENLRNPHFAGWVNYGAALKDPALWQALGFSLRFGVGTALVEAALGFGLAVFLAPFIRRHRWSLAILMLPMMVAPAMMGLMYRLVLHEFVGTIPYYWEMWLGTAPAFLAPDTVFATVFTIEVMQWTPFTLLLFYMAYEAIPPDIREAAAVDGTRPWRLFWAIEAPQLIPTVWVALIVRGIDGFRVFDNIYVLVGQGAGGETTSLSIYIYEAFFKRGDIGLTMATSLLLFVVAFTVLYLGNRWRTRSETA